MNCMFLRRPYKETAQTLEMSALWAGAVSVNTAGRNSSSQAAVRLRNIPETGLYYCFAFCDGDMSIDKIKDRSMTNLFKTGANTLTGDGSLSNGTAVLSLTGNAASMVYGGTLALVEFPSFEEAQIDLTLSSLSAGTSEGRNASSTAYVYMDVSFAGAYDVLFAAFSSFGMSVYLAPNVSDDPEPVFNTGTYGVLGYYASTGYNIRNSPTATRTRVYGGSIVGVNTV